MKMMSAAMDECYGMKQDMMCEAMDECDGAMDDSFGAMMSLGEAMGSAQGASLGAPAYNNLNKLSKSATYESLVDSLSTEGYWSDEELVTSFLTDDNSSLDIRLLRLNHD